MVHLLHTVQRCHGKGTRTKGVPFDINFTDNFQMTAHNLARHEKNCTKNYHESGKRLRHVHDDGINGNPVVSKRGRYIPIAINGIALDNTIPKTERKLRLHN